MGCEGQVLRANETCEGPRWWMMCFSLYFFVDGVVLVSKPLQVNMLVASLCLCVCLIN